MKALPFLLAGLVFAVVVVMCVDFWPDEKPELVEVRAVRQLPVEDRAWTPTRPATTTTVPPSTTTTYPKPTVRLIPKAPVRTVGIWDQLAECESEGRWDLNTGNGYYGGLQFSAATWRQAGGTRYAPLPHQASREQQIEIAEAWLAKTSWGSQWPHCSHVLGVA